MNISSYDILQEIANYDNAGLTNFLNILPDPDIILLKKREDARILRDIETDDQVTQSVINRKYRVLLNENYTVKVGVVGEETPTIQAEKVHKMILEDLENIVMYDTISSLLDAVFYGYSVLEIIWEIKDNFYRIKNIIPRPYYWFAFDKDNNLIFRGENIRQDKVPFGKFIMARHFPTFENPYGLRLLSRCLWSVAFKKGGVKFFARFLEKYGMPFVIANAVQGASRQEKENMAKDLYNMVQDAVAVLPAGAEVQLHSATTNQADIFNSYIDRWDKSIAKIIQGQTLTSDIGDTGSFAAANTHKSVSDDIARADMMMVTSSFNELFWIYTKINFGSDIKAPTFSYIDSEDLTQRAELDTKLYSMGVRFNDEYIEQTYGIDKKYFTVQETQAGFPAFANKLEGGNSAFPLSTFPHRQGSHFADTCSAAFHQKEINFAKDNMDTPNNDFKVLDMQIDKNIKLLADKLNIKTDIIKDIINTSDDLDDMADKLAYINMEYDDIKNLLQNIFTNSSLMGASNGK